MTKTTQIAKNEKFLLKDVKDWIRRLVNNNIQNWYSYINLNNWYCLQIRVYHQNYRIKWIVLYLHWEKCETYTCYWYYADLYLTSSKNLWKTIKKINSFIS